MKALLRIISKLLYVLSLLGMILIKFLVFVLFSPYIIYPCFPRAWRHRSIRAGVERFMWIWDAYWQKFRL